MVSSIASIASSLFSDKPKAQDPDERPGLSSLQPSDLKNPGGSQEGQKIPKDHVLGVNDMEYRNIFIHFHPFSSIFQELDAIDVPLYPFTTLTTQCAPESKFYAFLS